MTSISPELIHDANVYAIEYERVTKDLNLRATQGKDIVCISFRDVWGWELSPFFDQNVLFELEELSESELFQGDDCAEEGDSFIRRALQSGKRYFELESSVGLGGYVVAGDVAVHRVVGNGS